MAVGFKYLKLVFLGQWQANCCDQLAPLPWGALATSVC